MNTVHRDILELAAASIDFELSPAERSRLDAHLESCEACRRRIGGLRRDDLAIAALPSYDLAPAIAERLRPSAPRQPRLVAPSLRYIAVAALLALLAAASFAVGAELVRREVERRFAVVPPAPTAIIATPPPSQSPPVTAAPSATPDLGWQSLGPADTFVNAHLDTTSVTGQEELIVLGCIEEAAGVCGDAVAWLSPDGIAWSSVVLPTGPAETPIRSTAVARSATRTFVGGVVQRGDTFEAAVWGSDGEGTWTRASPIPSFSAAEVNGIVEFREGFVAVGSGLFGEPAGFRAWASSDGESWTPVSTDFGEDPPYATGVIELDDETLLAWGPTAAVGPGGTSWWSSADGVTWEAADDPPGLEESSVRTIKANETGYIAEGTAGIADAAESAEWSRSRSASQWTRTDALPDPPGSVIHRLTIDPGDVIVAAAAAGGEPVIVWHRAPGSDWRAAGEIPTGEPIAVAQIPLDPTHLVVFVRNDQGQTIVWRGPINAGS